MISFHQALSSATLVVNPCTLFNPFALRKAKIAYNLGLSECNGVNIVFPALFLSTSFLFTVESSELTQYVIHGHFCPLESEDIFWEVRNFDWFRLSF